MKRIVRTKIKKIIDMFISLGNLLLTVFILIYFLFCAVNLAHCLDEKVFIAVIKSRDIAPYNTALEGFSKALKDNGIDASLVQYNIEANKEKGLKVAQEIKMKNPQLVLTIGSLATEIAQQNIKETPVVFSMVLNPVASGLVKSMKSSGNNLTGASMDISIKHQFENLKRVVPHVRKIGVLYDPKNTKEIVENAREVAKEIDLVLISKPVFSEKDVPEALRKLGEEIDCLWAVADNTVFHSQSIQFIILYTLRNHIPFMGLSPSYVKAGTLLALSCDYEDIGRQSGELAVKVLTGQKPNELPITIPRKTFLSLNLRVAEQIGIKISSEVINGAKDVFK